VLPCAVSAACGDNLPGPTDTPDDAEGPAYVVGSIVSELGTSSTYINVVGSLGAQTLDYSTAYEFPGNADVWIWNGKVFVADGEAPVVRRYTLAADRTLVEDGMIGFAGYGVASTAFWYAIWISAEKAYMANGQGEYVIWNPSTMTITGTMPHPPLEDRGDLLVGPASTDRGVIVRGNRLYHPYYWANESYTDYAPDSRIAVYDTDEDRLLEVIEAPCPGLDIATADDFGNMYFSNWTGNAALTLVKGETPPCGIKLPVGTHAVDPAWDWTAITEGREASAMRFSGDRHALLSVFHQERIQFDADSDPWAVISTENWRIWRIDLETRQAAPIDAIAWNSGATYVQRIDGTTYLLVPSADYSTSQVYAVDGGSAQALFTTHGYGTRLFKVR
jgi:hypothetical protein